MSSEDADKELADFLVQNYCAGKLTARQTCTIGWFASRAGLNSLQGMALRPDSQSGHFSRKLQSYLGKDLKGDVYEVRRGMYDLPMLCPHEVLFEQAKGNDLETDIRHREKNAPPAYFAHPVYEEASQLYPTLCFLTEFNTRCMTA
eukprot:2248904-Amphidinium_carterae.1